MKDISRQINSLLMELDDCASEREEFKVICKLDELITKAKSSIYADENGDNYFIKASDTMMEDVCAYLNEFKNKYKCPGAGLYDIIVMKNTNSKKISVKVFSRGAINSHGLITRVEMFPRYTVSLILGLDKIEGKDYVKRTRFLVKAEYDKFMRLRKANPYYFLPFVKEITDNMSLVEVLI